MTDFAFVFGEGLNMGADVERMAIDSAYQQIDQVLTPPAPEKTRVETIELELA